MLTSVSTIVILMITCILVYFLLMYLLKKKNPAQTHKIFITMCILMLFWLLALILQATFSKILNIDPIYFDYFVYISICFLPVAFLLLSISFSNTKFKLTKKYLLLFIMPIISLLILWSNDWHHLFYEKYSINPSETTFGPYFYIHSFYTYILFFITLVNLLKYSIKNAGFFSKQAILILCGSLVPISVNLLALFGAISIDIYMTPISFAIAIVCYALAILKFDFLKVAPIALQRIVDQMSDSYVIVNDENIVTDFNQTLLDLFKVKAVQIRNKSLSDLFKEYEKLGINSDLMLNSVKKSREENVEVSLEEPLPSIDKYFHIEISNITNKNAYLGTLILLKDITQHTKDMQTIKQNQDMLIEKERLASLGQMIGGIAHNLKTPIMSIAGAAEGLSDLIKEYDMSIGDPEVTAQDNHDIAKDMTEWITKIRTHLSYMSDIITAIKGQAVAFGDQTSTEFTVNELLKMVNILMKHELKNAIINLNTQADIDVSTIVKGNINSLVQVVNNIISNGIQAYQSQNKSNENIDFTVYKEKQNLVLKIQDSAGGLPEKVQESLFKEMITTKGKNGSGLGLFMSYSNIKAHFSGNMRYETKKGEGTTFYIEIPL